MKSIYCAIALNMISVAVIAQTPIQPAERVQTPVMGTEYGKEKTEMTDKGFRKPENAPTENPTPAEKLSVPRPVEENRPLLAQQSPAKAVKSNRTAPTRRPLPISFSVGALMLSANR